MDRKTSFSKKYSDKEWPKRIKQLRQALGLSILKLSEIIEIPNKTLERWEYNQIMPSIGIQKLYEKELERMLEAKQEEQK